MNFYRCIRHAGIRSAKKLVSQLRRTLGGQFPPAIYTLGFGQDHDADFLMQIADAGKGQVAAGTIPHVFKAFTSCGPAANLFNPNLCCLGYIYSICSLELISVHVARGMNSIDKENECCSFCLVL